MDSPSHVGLPFRSQISDFPVCFLDNPPPPGKWRRPYWERPHTSFNVVRSVDGKPTIGILLGLFLLLFPPIKIFIRSVPWLEKNLATKKKRKKTTQVGCPHIPPRRPHSPMPPRTILVMFKVDGRIPPDNEFPRKLDKAWQRKKSLAFPYKATASEIGTFFWVALMSFFQGGGKEKKRTHHVLKSVGITSGKNRTQRLQRSC